jgi:hypothetical protein
MTESELGMSRRSIFRPTALPERHAPGALYGYDLCLTTISIHATRFASSLFEGRRPETILKAERGVASRGGGS